MRRAGPGEVVGRGGWARGGAWAREQHVEALSLPEGTTTHALLCEVASTERRRCRAACNALHAQGTGQARRQGERCRRKLAACESQRILSGLIRPSCPPPSIVALARRSRRVEKWARFLSRSPFSSSTMVHLARAHFSSTRAGKKSSSLSPWQVGRRNLITGKRSRFSYLVLPYVINGHQACCSPPCPCAMHVHDSVHPRGHQNQRNRKQLINAAQKRWKLKKREDGVPRP